MPIGGPKPNCGLFLAMRYVSFPVTTTPVLAQPRRATLAIAAENAHACIFIRFMIRTPFPAPKIADIRAQTAMGINLRYSISGCILNSMSRSPLMMLAWPRPAHLYPQRGVGGRCISPTARQCLLRPSQALWPTLAEWSSSQCDMALRDYGGGRALVGTLHPAPRQRMMVGTHKAKRRKLLN